MGLRRCPRSRKGKSPARGLSNAMEILFQLNRTSYETITEGRNLVASKAGSYVGPICFDSDSATMVQLGCI